MYIKVESAYIYAVMSFIRLNHLEFVRANDIECYSEKNELDDKTSDSMRALFINKQKKNSISLKTDQVPDICKLILRDYLWARLFVLNQIMVEFGNDYYMYIYSHKSNLLLLDKIKNTGLFAEPINSFPY